MLKELGEYTQEERSRAISQLRVNEEWEQYTPHQRAQKLLALLKNKKTRPATSAVIPTP